MQTEAHRILLVSEPTTGPFEPVQIESQSWIFRHPGAVLTFMVMIATAVQWGFMHWQEEQLEPHIQELQSNDRALATYQLESGRYMRNILEQVAKQYNITVQKPVELERAEKRVFAIKESH